MPIKERYANIFYKRLGGLNGSPFLSKYNHSIYHKYKIIQTKRGKTHYPTVKQAEQVRLVSPYEAFEFALQFYDEDTIQHHITTKVILLSGNSTVLGVMTVSESAHTYDIVETKFILQAAILANAKSIIVVSNSPSGDLEPNDAEKDLKNQIKLAAYLSY